MTRLRTATLAAARPAGDDLAQRLLVAGTVTALLWAFALRPWFLGLT